MSARARRATARKPQGEHPRRQRRQPGRESLMQPAPVTITDDYHGSGKLGGRTAVITGGDSGIGRAVAAHFAREGADVAFLYFDEHEDARITCRLIEDEGRRCLAIAGDARSEDHCQDAIATVMREFGRIDVLVNHLGVQYPQQRPEDIDAAQLEQTFRTNVYPYFFVTRAVLPHLAEGACIINTGSVTSFRGRGDLVDYSATKGAIESMTYALATQLADRGIRVNGVAPGPIWTPLIAASFDQKQIERFGTSTLLGRAGQPAEVAPAYVYLACRDSAFVTGQFIHVNGGSHIGG